MFDDNGDWTTGGFDVNAATAGGFRLADDALNGFFRVQAIDAAGRQANRIAPSQSTVVILAVVVLVGVLLLKR